MNRLASVVCGVDFSPNSATALRQALRIAAWNRSTLRVVHVAEPLIEAMPDPVFLPFPIVDIGIDPAQTARDAWEGFAKDLPERAGLKLDIIVGGPLLEISRVVREAHAELLVVGSQGHLTREKGVGLFAAGCVRRSGTRVLLVTATQTGPFRTIVACVDFSATSLDAVSAAARIAAQDAASLHILHVFRPPWMHPHRRAPDPLASPEFQESYREAMGKHVAAFVKPLEHELVYLKPKYVAVEGEHHGRGITDYSVSVGADLVVMGTRGKTELRDFVLGNTTERVLREATCSVLTVPPPVA